MGAFPLVASQAQVLSAEVTGMGSQAQVLKGQQWGGQEPEVVQLDGVTSFRDSSVTQLSPVWAPCPGLPPPLSHCLVLGQLHPRPKIVSRQDGATPRARGIML